MLALAWLFYLSLVHGGGAFLSFQWDSLLLEAGFLSLLAAPWGWRARGGSPPRAAIWLLRLLLFKLMFSSGATKLSWGDPSWWDGSALEYHWWTQPLPTPMARVAAALPEAVQRAACFVMLVVETLVPFAIFGPRRARHVAFGAFVALQVAIALTGNYGFFNLLSVVLCLAILDDRAIEWWVGPKGPKHVAADRTEGRRRTLARAVVVSTVCLVTLLLSVGSFGEALRWRPARESALGRLRSLTAPFYLNNGYGLFRIMTKTRPEIAIEVSQEGLVWRPLVFRWKPGPAERGLPWVAPHMPRLDWQMWFAGLSAEQALEVQGGRPAPDLLPLWLSGLSDAILEGRAPVLRLFEDESGRPRPRWLRMRLDQYRFARPDKGKTWTVQEVGWVLPPVRREGSSSRAPRRGGR
jgi:uncharacterized membrane protein YphA (DoxX/SURF4 family)